MKETYYKTTCIVGPHYGKEKEERGRGRSRRRGKSMKKKKERKKGKGIFGYKKKKPDSPKNQKGCPKVSSRPMKSQQ